MKTLFYLLVTLLITTPLFAQEGGKTISAEELKGHVYFLASDEMKGRGTDTDEYRRIAQYAASQFRAAGLKPPFGSSGASPSFIQEFRFSLSGSDYQRRVGGDRKPVGNKIELVSYNVVGIIEGTDPNLKAEFVTIGAHLDHLGVRNGQIHNGANDNATGSASVLELAEEIAKNPPKRSVLFGLWGAEEVGLYGSQYFVSNSPLPVSNFVAYLNIDGVGRYNNQGVAEIKLQALGADAICKNLQTVMEDENKKFGKLTLDQNDSNKYFYFASDQVAFHKADVPAIMFTDLGSGVYHSPADDAEPVEYEKLETLTVFLYRLANRIGNMGERVCKAAKP